MATIRPPSCNFSRLMIPSSLHRHLHFKLSIAFVAFFLFFSSISPLALASYAQGNLFIVFHPKSGRSSEQTPQMANLSSLWCQATPNSLDRLQIKEARFVRTLPKPEEIFPPSKYSKKNERAFLVFGTVSTTAIGKYRCEITTTEGEFVTGNLFVYMRPILVYNSTTRLDQSEEGNLFAWVGPPVKAHVGDDTQLTCNVVGYPLPQIRWFKDELPINVSAILATNGGDGAEVGNAAGDQRKYLLTAQSLYIRKIEENDEGNYKCIATNTFALHVDDVPREFQLHFDQQLQITTQLSWLIPLLIIVAGLILLGLIIWGCSQWKQYKYEQYNVAQKERELGKKGVADGQKLPLDQDDVEEY